MKHLNLFIMTLLICSWFSSASQPLQTVKSVDLNKYMGKWYEIALFPQRFEKGCYCSTAEYTLMNGYVKVVNACRKNGKLSKAVGKAFVVKDSGNAKLKVQFFWPFKGKYWIIEVADDYSYAVVGAPDRKYLWILCRTTHMDDNLYQELLKKIESKGFDVKKLVKTYQDCY